MRSRLISLSSGSFLLMFLLVAASIPAIAGVACNQVIATQEAVSQKQIQNMSQGAITAAAQVQASQASQLGASQGCLSTLSNVGGTFNYPKSWSALQQMLEQMGCSMATGTAMSAVSTMTSPLNSYSSYGLGGNVGFGQNGFNTVDSGPPPVLTGTASSVLGSATGGVSSIFGNMGSSLVNKANGLPGANTGQLPGTNTMTNGVNNSFNNIYK